MLCRHDTHVHTHIGGGFPGSQRKRRQVVGVQWWLGARLGRRDCPQTRERSPLGAVTVVPPGGWSLVDNKRNTHGSLELLVWCFQTQSTSFFVLFCGVCVPFIINQTPAAGGDHVTAPSGLRSRVCGQSLRPSLAPNHFW